MLEVADNVCFSSAITALVNVRAHLQMSRTFWFKRVPISFDSSARAPVGHYRTGVAKWADGGAAERAVAVWFTGASRNWKREPN